LKRWKLLSWRFAVFTLITVVVIANMLFNRIQFNGLQTVTDTPQIVQITATQKKRLQEQFYLLASKLTTWSLELIDRTSIQEIFPHKILSESSISC
jgi:hypothetical protein